MSSYHDQMMNVQDSDLYDGVGSFDPAYVIGVRHARIACAEIAAQADARIAELAASLKEMVARNAMLRQRPDLPADRIPQTLEYEKQIADLEAIVAKLPLTADNVRVVPGVQVWYPGELWRSWEVDYDNGEFYVPINPDRKGNEWEEVEVGECYSAKSAAVAATGKGASDGVE